MNDQMLAVMRRREELLGRIATQRGQLAEAGARWETPLALADQGLSILLFLRARPVLTAGLAALFIVHRRGLAGLAKSGWMAWKAYRYFASLSARLSSRP